MPAKQQLCLAVKETSTQERKSLFNIRVSSAALQVCHRNPQHIKSFLTIAILNTQNNN